MGRILLRDTAYAYSTTDCTFLQSILVGISVNVEKIIAATLMAEKNVYGWCFWLFAGAAFLIGTLAPDIDNEKSMLGQMLHLNLEHRTWTHSIWAVLAAGILSCIAPIFWWFTLGYVGHLVWDTPSKCGVCWFYPISKYRHFGDNGAKIKNGHQYYLYRAGNQSETILVAGLVIITVICGFWFVFGHIYGVKLL